jgi:ABC-2 type transport system ATP-binding protein
MDSYAIRLQNVTKIYKKRKFLSTEKIIGIKEVSFAVKKGEIFSLLGPNGAGKTTTLKLILGLLFPDEGEIYILGEKISQHNRNYITKVGFIPELPYFYPYLTPYEVLTLYAKLSNQTKIDNETLNKKIQSVLERVGLQNAATRKMREFSKGMLQRVAIAQAILHEPEILIFDEPVAGLDPVGIRDIREMILAFKSENKTILMSSHIISEVEKISDCAGILHAGKLKLMLSRNDWEKYSGGLEEIFIKAVKN